MRSRSSPRSEEILTTKSGIRSRRRFRNLIVYWPILLPLIFYLPALFGFPYPSPDAEFSDIAITHLPNYLYLKQAIIHEGVVPLWSPLLFSGTPFAANPLSGLWYPPGWFALLFPPQVGFGLTASLHVLWGGIGMILFLRSQGLSTRASLFGGLAYEALPKLIAHFGAGHLTITYAIPWLPWLLWVTTWGDSDRPSRRFLFGPALILAMIILADPRIAAYAALLWILWGITSLLKGCFVLKRSGWGEIRIPRWIFIPGWIVLELAAACALAAVLLIPMLEFSRLSTRSALDSADILAFSLPFTGLLNLIFPNFGGNHELTIYAGAIVFILTALSMTWTSARKRGWFWIAILLLTLLISLGENLPFTELVTRIPGVNLLRVPTRALFLAGFSMSVLAAYGLDSLEAGLSETDARRGRLTLTAFLFLGLLAVILSLLAAGSGAASGFFWGGVFFFSGSLWIWLQLSGRLKVTYWFAVLIILSLLDWGLINRTLMVARSPDQVLAERSALAEKISEDTGNYRVYSPSYSLPQQTAALYDIEQANGVDPLHLASYRDFMNGATGVTGTGYAVSIPPFEGDNPRTANADSLPDPEKLGFLNVKYILADFDLQSDRFQLADMIDGVRLYLNPDALPRAWVQRSDADPDEEGVPITILDEALHHRTLSGQGPGTLVYSEVYYPGWEVLVDGVRKPIRLVDGLLLGVDLPLGSHEIEFRFAPISVFLGLGVTLGAFLGALILLYTDITRFIGICNASER